MPGLTRPKLRTIRARIIPLLVLLTLTSLPSCERAQQPREIKIGAILPLTGDAASWGDQGKKGIDLAAEEINSAGGIDGSRLVVIYEDTQATPRRAATAMQKLCTVDRVSAVIGDIVSATTLAVAPIAEQNRVLLLSPTASAPAISDVGDYIFRIWPSDIAEGTAIVEFAFQTLGLRRVAILYIENDYGVGLRRVFEKKFSGLGGTITAALGYKQDETDFRSYLTKIRGSAPEAIYLVSYYKDASLALRQARELGIRSEFLGTTALEDPHLISIAGRAADGVIYPMSTGYDPKSADTAVQDFKARFRARFGEDPGFVSAHAYDALKLIAFAMKISGTTGPEIRTGLLRVRDFHGATGTINFDSKGDVIKQTTIKEIRNGQFVHYSR